MSWDKNTINASKIEDVIELAQELELPFTVETIGTVIGNGMNDTFADRDKYTLRKLTIGRIVYIDQMQRTTDCDTDDVIVSHKFDINEVPNNLPLEIMIDSETGQVLEH